MLRTSENRQRSHPLARKGRLPTPAEMLRIKCGELDRKEGGGYLAKSMDEELDFRVDRSVLSIGSLSDPSDEKAYWLSRSPADRLAALELMRRILYGYNPATARLQRVLEFAQQP